jgi:uncharacterized protein YaiE (UPF0345 family)
MDLIVYPLGKAQVTLTANQSIAVFTTDKAVVTQLVGYPNEPAKPTVLGTVLANGQTVFGPFSSGATIIIEAQAAQVRYQVGAAPLVMSLYATSVQGAPVAVDVTGAVSAAAMMGGLITSSTAAAVAGTIPTGTVMDAASTFLVNDSFEWSVINTGPNTFTVTAASGHTIVGAAAVATATTGQFRTRKTAANTFVTYRIS